MRTSLKKPKPKAPTILQQESTKLKQKLQLLRQQVTQKKQQKQMNKTATSLQSSTKPLNQNHHQQNSNKLLSQTTTKAMNMSKLPDSKLKNALVEGKIQAIQDKLKERGIKTYERFLQVTDEQVDQWKDIAVGWRIKLKKLIKTCKEKKQPNQSVIGNSTTQDLKQTNAQQQQQSIQKQTQQLPKQKNIQDIIKQRKQVQIFVPICRQIEQFNEQYYQQHQETEMTEQDQDVIIQSFMKVFQPRRGIISKDSKIANSPGKQKQINLLKDKEKKVSWSRKVQQLEKQFTQKNHKKYPKQSIPKTTLMHNTQQKITSSQSLPDQKDDLVIKYCWKCFRKINIKENIGFRVSKETEDETGKYFCSEKCQLIYNDEVAKFENNLDGRHDGQDDSHQMEENKTKYEEEQDIQTIDLSIF